MKEKEYKEIIEGEDFKEAYPIPLEQFGKDFISTLCMLQGYKKSFDNNISLRMAANTIRKQMLACSQGTVDILELKWPYPKWTKETLFLTQIEEKI